MSGFRITTRLSRLSKSSEQHAKDMWAAVGHGLCWVALLKGVLPKLLSKALPVVTMQRSNNRPVRRRHRQRQYGKIVIVHSSFTVTEATVSYRAAFLRFYTLFATTLPTSHPRNMRDFVSKVPGSV